MSKPATRRGRRQTKRTTGSAAVEQFPPLVPDETFAGAGGGDELLPVDTAEIPGWLMSEDPVGVAASALLRRALTCGQQVASAVLVDVWTPAWVSPLQNAWPTVISQVETDRGSTQSPSEAHLDAWVLFAFSAEANAEAKKWDRKDETTGIAKALALCRRVCVFACEPDRLIPLEILRALDQRLAVRGFDPDLLQQIAERLTQDKAAIRIDAAACAAVTPAILQLARRRGQTADDYLERVNGLARPILPDTSLMLDDLKGMTEAIAWGDDLARDLASYRDGDLAWSAVDRGCVLVGPPGTGKTTFARALANTCKVPLIVGSYARWQADRQGYLGDLLRAMASTFERARQAAPSILFIDELDSFYSRTGSTQHPDWWTSVVNSLLEQLDGIERREGVVVVGATNHLSLVDPAIIRSGRLDRTIFIPSPDRKALIGIFRFHLAGDLASADISQAALNAAGATGADCERWVRGARRHARRHARSMQLEDLLVEIRGDVRERSEAHRRLLAVHEAGHALLLALEQPGRLRHATIQAREGGGAKVVSEIAEGVVRRDFIGVLLRYLLAGRAAEDVILGAASAGAGGPEESDLAQATRIAFAAETAFGFSESPLLWRGYWDGRDLASLMLVNSTAAERVNARLTQAYGEVCAIVREHRDAIERIADLLLARGVAEGEEIEVIVNVHRGPLVRCDSRQSL